MKNKIPQFLISEFPKRKPDYKNFSNEINKFILDYAKYYNWEIVDIKLIFKMMRKGLSTRPICSCHSCNNLVMIVSDYADFSKGCSVLHARKISVLKKYGVDSVFKTDEFIEKSNNSKLKKFGTIHISQNEQIKKQKKETMLKKYGVSHALQSKEFLKKSQDTCLKNNGVKYPTQSQIVREKIEKSNIKNFGTKHPLQNNEIKEKAMKTHFANNDGIGFQTKKAIKTIKEKYGVENVMQNSKIAEKNLKSQFSKKEFIWTTGEISITQGYENIILSELEKNGYSFNDVITDYTQMPEFWYYFKGNKKRYLPDIFIPSENLIIEVKSTYTYEADLEKNLAKEQAVLQAGFDFRFEIR